LAKTGHQYSNTNHESYATDLLQNATNATKTVNLTSISEVNLYNYICLFYAECVQRQYHTLQLQNHSCQMNTTSDMGNYITTKNDEIIVGPRKGMSHWSLFKLDNYQ